MFRKLFFLMIAMSSLGSAQHTVRYALAMPRPAVHLFEVEAQLDNIQEHSVDFRIPVWRPGRYQVFDFAGGIQEFSAADGRDAPLGWEKIDKATWRVATAGAGTVRIRYKVYANEFQLRTRGLNQDHAFVDGAAVFMYVEELRALPVELAITPVEGWHVTTGLEGNGWTFKAPTYDYFVDCPIEIGTQKDFSFSVDGVPHVLSIAGEGDWNADTLIRDISRIVKAQKDFFGSFPYRRYVFLLHCSPSSGGGTEHVNSSIMGISPLLFSTPDGTGQFLGLISHEYFHTWNVKQFRPKGLSPYDFARENYTRELWIAEGTTSYYDRLFLVRAGFLPEAKYLEILAGMVAGDRQRPGNAIQPLAESSFDAWVKFWKMTEQSFNAESDYYDKGSCVSLLLDLEIRRRSANAASLDDVMRSMYKDFPPSGPGYTTDDLRRAAEKCAGGSLEEFFRDYVTGTVPLPWESAFDAAGLTLAPKDTNRHSWIGVTVSDVGERTRFVRVVAGSPAEKAGVSVGDELVALDGLRVRKKAFEDRLASYPQGATALLTVIRDERLRELHIKVGTATVPSYQLTRGGSLSDLQRAILRTWLEGNNQ